MTNNTKKFYVYGHYTLDTNELFHIGKGCKKRYLDSSGSNEYWHRVVNSHGYRAEILIDGLDEPGAFLQEILGIAFYKPRTNFTKGGAGGFIKLNKGNFTKGTKPWNTGKKCPGISQRQLGRKMAPEANIKKRVAVICVTDNREFLSLKDVVETYNIGHTTLVACLTGRTDTAGGKSFVYKDEARRNKAEHRRRSRPTNKVMIQCVETGMIYESIKACSVELNLHTSNIVRVLQGARNQTGALTFRYYTKDYI